MNKVLKNMLGDKKSRNSEVKERVRKCTNCGTEKLVTASVTDMHKPWKCKKCR